MANAINSQINQTRTRDYRRDLRHAGFILLAVAAAINVLGAVIGAVIGLLAQHLLVRRGIVKAWVARSIAFLLIVGVGYLSAPGIAGALEDAFYKITRQGGIFALVSDFKIGWGVCTPLAVTMAVTAIVSVYIDQIKDLIDTSTIGLDPVKPHTGGVHKPGKALIGFTEKDTPVYMPMIPGAHGLCTGSTGFGKSSTISNVIEAAIEQGQTVIAIDGKGVKGSYSFHQLFLYEKYKHNRKLAIIDMTDPKNSNKYNPFKNAPPAAIRDMLMAMSEWSEPHYKAQANNYWGAMCEAMAKAGEATTLNNMLLFSSPKELIDLVKHLQSEEVISETLATKWVNTATVCGATAEAAAARFAGLTEGVAGEIFGVAGGIDLIDVYRENALFLVLIDKQTYGAFASAVGGLVIQDLKKLSGYLNHQEKKGQTLVVMDEIGSYISPDVVYLFSQSRTAGMQVMALCQSPTDLEISEAGKNLRDELIDNTNLFFIHRANNHDTAVDISNIIGAERGIDVTHRTDGQYLEEKSMVKAADVLRVNPERLKELPKNVGYFANKYDAPDKKPVRYTTRYVDFSTLPRRDNSKK